MKKKLFRFCLQFGLLVSVYLMPYLIQAAPNEPVMIININNPIDPATDDFLKTSVAKATERKAKLLIVQLDTPGGLLTSMKSMVNTLLDSPVPTAVYVAPGGAGALSAGVFLVYAGNVAVMAPGTTIGAAHPVSAGGEDVEGDMRAKIENSTVSFIKAIAEQRKRNVSWAEKAVRESVAITDKEALEQKVIDLIAKDVNHLLVQLEGKVIKIKDREIKFEGLAEAPQEVVEMTLKQKVLNVLCDPNIAILLGLGAMLGLGVELYHPGAVFPGVFGMVCLVLSLIAGQVLPISYGGVLLLLLGGVFFVVEAFVPSFGIWGIAGTICFVLGALYVVDTDLVWGSEAFEVNRQMVSMVAGTIGALFIGLSYLLVYGKKERVSSGLEGMISEVGVVKKSFNAKGGRGKIFVKGEIWDAVAKAKEGGLGEFVVGEEVVVVGVEKGMTLVVDFVKKEN